jgi:hypothetical protein
MAAITSVEIENFRCFQKLRVDGLAPVNLIVGENNAGKTVLLEAIEAVVSRDSPFVLYRAAFERNEYRRHRGSAEDPVRCRPHRRVCRDGARGSLMARAINDKIDALFVEGPDDGAVVNALMEKLADIDLARPPHRVVRTREDLVRGLPIRSTPASDAFLAWFTTLFLI